MKASTQRNDVCRRGFRWRAGSRQALTAHRIPVARAATAASRAQLEPGRFAGRAATKPARTRSPRVLPASLARRLSSGPGTGEPRRGGAPATASESQLPHDTAAFEPVADRGQGLSASAVTQNPPLGRRSISAGSGPLASLPNSPSSTALSSTFEHKHARPSSRILLFHRLGGWKASKGICIEAGEQQQRCDPA